MDYLIPIFILAIGLRGYCSEAFPGKGPVDDEARQAYQLCEDFCERRYARLCVDLPMQCGRCLPGFIDHDGLCLPYHEQQQELHLPDQEIDKIAARQQSTETEAEIPENAQIHSIQHSPGHSQQDKVADMYRAAALPSPAALAAQDPNAKAAAIKDVANMADVYFLAVVAGCSIAGLVGLVVAGVCWYRLQKNVKAASEAEYPAYGVTGPAGAGGAGGEKAGSPGDRKLAQSAQMYHYQHQKQQMIALEKANGDMTKDASDADSDEENEEGDYTVYECPGLAPTGEMEVKNPLFTEDTPQTPSAPPPPPSSHN